MMNTNCKLTLIHNCSVDEFDAKIRILDASLMVLIDANSTCTSLVFRRTERKGIRRCLSTWASLSLGRAIPLSVDQIEIRGLDSILVRPCWPADFILHLYNLDSPEFYHNFKEFFYAPHR